MNNRLNNSSVRQIIELVYQEIGRLSLARCQVESVKLDSDRATILISSGSELPVHCEEGGYAVFQKDTIKIVWRIPTVD